MKQGYKQTDIGLIPEDWDAVPLLSKCDLLNGLTYTPDDVVNNGLLVLRSSNIQHSKLVFLDNVFVNLTVDKKQLVKKNDIIICVRNGSANLIGKCAKAEKDYNATFGAFMAVLRGVNNDYIYQILQQGTIQKLINKNSDSTINQITNGDFKSIKILFPVHKNERSRIAEVLSDVDELIASLEKLIEKKKALKQGVMQELLTGKRRLPGFTEEWVEISFESIYSYAKEGGTPSTSNELYYKNGDIPFIKIEDLAMKYIDTGTTYITNEGIEHSSAWIIPANSAILSNGATIGEVSINRIPVATKQGILGIIPDVSIDIEFLYYLFSTTRFRDDVKRITTHGTMDCAYLKDLNTIRLFIPSDKNEQIKISSILSDIDNEIVAKERELQKYRRLKSGMMSELLTGRIRLV